MPENNEIIMVNYMPDVECADVPEGAAIYIPEGTVLSDAAMETISHMHYYMNGKNGFVLLSDRTGIIVDAASIPDMGDEAQNIADVVCGNMPDFSPYPMDDGCTLVTMQGNAVAFCPQSLFNGSQLANMGAALAMRGELMEACDEFNLLAIVYNDKNDDVMYN